VVLVNAEKLIDESITTLKDISNKLSPHILINFGLLKAVKSFINRLQIIGDPILKFNSNIDDKRFAYNIEVVLYRVIGELVSNTLKHAGAHNVYIDLMTDEKNISLKYIDDGIGFDVGREEKNLTGMGYSNIKSRIKACMWDRLEIMSKYQVSSLGEFEKRVRDGSVHEHPGWEDLIILENIENSISKLRTELSHVKNVSIA